MSAGFNQSIILGRLTAPAEQLTTKNGKLFIKATIAVSVRRKNAEGVDEERTSFIPVTIFGRTAEIFRAYVQKGDMVHLVGRLESSDWTTGSGEKRLSLSFVAEQLNLLPNERIKSKSSTDSGKPTVNRTNQPPLVSSPTKARPAELDENGDPTEIPF